MAPLCELEEHHGVDLGQGYKNSRGCAGFNDYTAHELLQNLLASISQVKFFSVQADSSMDSGNVEDEVFMIVYCDLYGKVRVVS